ncbi:hypothetical protein LHM76_002713 [Listeria monocytogenes]|nr:hypothetical protein [Listeria monocytogenes]
MTKIQIARYQRPDKRLQTTQDKLFAALKERFDSGQKFSDVQVSSLCKDANVARQTFYRHYITVGEIIEVNFARMMNQFFQHVDKTINSTKVAAKLTVTILNDNKTLVAMVFWAKVESQVIQFMVRDMARINSFQTERVPFDALRAERLARSIISFAEVMLKYPQVSQQELIQIYKDTIPSPKIIFKE